MTRTITVEPVKPKAAAKAEVQYLGRGIDVLTNDLLSGAPPDRDRVVALTAHRPEVTSDIPELHTDTIVQQGYTEFTKALAIEAGLRATYGAFTGSIDAKFSSDVRSTSEAYFARVQASCSRRVVSIGRNARVLTKHLTDEFNDALASDSADEILDTFGTHVAVEVEYGGRCSYMVSSTAYSELSEQQFEARASAKYASVSGHAGVSLVTSHTIENSEHITRWDVRGGDIAIDLDQQGVHGWAASVVRGPTFLGFTKNGLVPIWELAGKRRAELLLAFRRRAALDPVVRVFTKTSGKEEWPKASVEVPHDYKLLSGGAKVNFARPGNHLIASYPENDDTWTAQSKSHLQGSPATITVYAIGLYDPDDWNLWDVTRVEATGDKSGAPSATVAVPCGYILVGGGALDTIVDGPGNHLTASYPEDGNWRASGHDHSKVSKGQVTAYAIGIRCRVPGIVVEPTVITSKPSQKTGWPTAEQPMDRDFLLVGGGAWCEWSGWGQILTGSYPDEQHHKWIASSKDHIHPDSGRVIATAVGIKVTVAEVSGSAARPRRLAI